MSDNTTEKKIAQELINQIMEFFSVVYMNEALKNEDHPPLIKDARILKIVKKLLSQHKEACREDAYNKGYQAAMKIKLGIKPKEYNLLSPYGRHKLSPKEGE